MCVCVCVVYVYVYIIYIYIYIYTHITPYDEGRGTSASDAPRSIPNTSK